RRYHGKTYLETLNALDKLIIINQPKDLRPHDTKQSWNVDAMKFYIKQMNMDLSKLSIIHVAGTKGKGSTCTTCESILRNSGYKTGLYTSPHLIDVRERIRVNGVPVPKEQFVKHFWECYEQLENSKNEMFPSIATYFRFLTLMSFRIFIEEKVDVAIIEVGLGGLMDATNVIQPAVVGLTSIGYDHVEILGNTLTEIAGQKAGIMKPNIISISSVGQKQEAMDQFIKTAGNVHSPLFTSPTIQEIFNNQELPKIGLSGEHQLVNTSLALCLCDAWINRKNHSDTKQNTLGETYTFKEPISEDAIRGLAACRYEGRGQIISLDRNQLDITFYLDGAHTDDSIAFCVDWFEKSQEDESTARSDLEVVTAAEEDDTFVSDDKQLRDYFDNFVIKSDAKKGRKINVLVFNFTGTRDASTLLIPLSRKGHLFDAVIFCPNDSDKDSLLSSTVNNTELSEPQKKKLSHNKQVWDEACKERTQSMVHSSINQAIQWISEEYCHDHVRVLVTGSLYLVGDTLRKLNFIKAK
ncbi:Folylpolyglutamate synthase, partial [Acrasis kona]